MLRKVLLLVAFLILVAIGLVWARIIDPSWSGNPSDPVQVKVNPVEVGTTNTVMQVPVVGTRERQVQTPTLRVNDGSGEQPTAAQQPATPPQGNTQ